MRSRRVPGAMTDEELFAVDSDKVETEVDEDYSNLLTVEEKEQLENVLKADHVDDGDEFSDGAGRLDHGLQNASYDYLTEEYDDGFTEDDTETSLRQTPLQNGHGELPCSSKEEKKGRWFAWGKKSLKRDGGKKLDGLKASEGPTDKVTEVPSTSNESLKKAKQNSGMPTEAQWKPVNRRRSVDGRRSVDSQLPSFENRVSLDRRPSSVDDLLSAKGKGKEHKLNHRNSSSNKELIKSKTRRSSVKPESSSESEYKKGLRPILWLTPDFPLKTDELLPLLDILANKVKAIRRLRELLTTKLPAGTFPVKVCSFRPSILLCLCTLLHCQ